MKNVMNWITCAILVAVGILLLAAPTFCIRVIVVLFGLATVIEGFYGIITERTLFSDSIFQTTILGRSIGNIIIGLLAIVMPLALAETAWSIMTFILAIYLILSSGAGFVASSKLRNTEADRKQFILENIIMLFAGILLLVIGPKTLGKAIIRFIGIVVLAVGGIFIAMQIMRTKNNIIVTDAEVKDDDEKIEDSEN